jgi:hypothetical protein
MRTTIVLTALALIVGACGRTADVESSSPATPEKYSFASADEAWAVLKTGQGMSGSCGTMPHAIGGDEEGSTGQLNCVKMTISPSNGKWLLNLWTYSDDFYAEHGYRTSCADIPRGDHGGWWVIWEPGQNWFAELGPDADVGGRTPPDFAAEKVASVLHSTAWNDCDAVK